MAKEHSEQATMTPEFSLILSSPTVTTEDCNVLYEAGCDDGTISTSRGVTRIIFDREAASLEEAIRSAIGNVISAGFTVARVELDVERFIPQPA